LSLLPQRHPSRLCPVECPSQWVNPESFKRGIVSVVIDALQQDRLYDLVAMQLMNVTASQLATVFISQVGTSIWSALVQFHTSGPGVALVFQGRSAFSSANRVIGNGTTPGTIRGTYWNARSSGFDRVVDNVEDVNLVWAAVAAFFPGGVVGWSK
jgi:nucleoside diphosphate kinase